MHILYYSTLVSIVGLTGILFPINHGNDQIAHQALAAASQISPDHPSSLKPQNEASRHDDDTLAALTIYFEAKGESFAGKLAVAAVIRNRMVHHFQSDGTVRGTVLRPKQFEPWITRNPDTIPFNPSNIKMQESLLAWKLVQDGREVVNGAVLFYNPEIVKSPRWARVHRKVAKIGGHEFFHTERI
ncbi:MAG: cell wall hydrolase [Nitrospirales bacterium]